MGYCRSEPRALSPLHGHDTVVHVGARHTAGCTRDGVYTRVYQVGVYTRVYQVGIDQEVPWWV